MKTVEVSESALESLKAMVEQLHSERDELLLVLKSALETAKFERHAARPWHHEAYAIIARCTQAQSICDWQEKMPR